MDNVTATYRPGEAVVKTALEVKVETLEEEVDDLKRQNERLREEIDRMWDEIYAIGRRME